MRRQVTIWKEILQTQINQPIHSGIGEWGNLNRLDYLSQDAVIVAPNGYKKSWNVNKERSNADDVGFILELITKVLEEEESAEDKLR